MSEASDKPPIVSATLGVVKSASHWRRSLAEFFRSGELPATAKVPKPPSRFPVLASVLYVGPPVDHVFASVVFAGDALRLLRATHGFGASGSGSDLRVETVLLRLMIEGEICTEERAISLLRQIGAGETKELSELRKRLVKALHRGG